MKRQLLRFLAAFLIFAASTFTSAQGNTVQLIDFPGAAATFPRSINGAGDVVGFYRTNGFHGFILHDGNYTAINVPSDWDGFNTSAAGVSDSGDVVGTYNHIDGDGRNHQHGFILSNGQFSKIDVPGASDTIPSSVSLANVAGTFVQNGRKHGFIGANDAAVSFDVPGATFTFIRGINNNGDAAGYYADGSGNHGFVLRSGGSFISFDVPGSNGGLVVTAINDLLQPAGYLDDSSSAAAPSDPLGFEPPRSAAHGFVINGSAVRVNVPGANNTFVWGINDSEWVSGYFFSAQGVIHGFKMRISATQ